MGKTLAIAFNTYTEARRNRILAIFIFFAIGLMVVSGAAAELAIGEKEKIVRDLGLMGINLFGLLVALFVGIGLVHNDIDRRTIYTIISKPINRSHFIVGKYLGLLFTIYVATLLMAFFFFFVLHFSRYYDDALINSWLQEKQFALPWDIWSYLAYYGVHMGAAAIDSLCTFWIPFVPAGELAAHSQVITDFIAPLGISVDLAAIDATTKNLLPTIILSCGELSIITAFAVLFSVISSPFLAFSFTGVTVVIGRLWLDIMRFADRFAEDAAKQKRDLTGNEETKIAFAKLAALISPNLTYFNVRYSVIYDGTLPLKDGGFWGALLYAGCYSACVLMATIYIFNRRSFK